MRQVSWDNSLKIASLTINTQRYEPARALTYSMNIVGVFKSQKMEE